MGSPISQLPAGSRSVFKLPSVTRGFRLINWLAGRTATPWIDRLAGRVALRVARAHGARPQAAWPGPVWSNSAFGAPLLSWFVAPVADASTDAFVAAIDAALLAEPLAGKSSDVTRLMQRVLDAHATRVRTRIAHCPPALAAVRDTTRVLLIDERASSRGISALPSRNDSKAFARLVDKAVAAHLDAEFWIARSSDTGTGRWLSSSIPALPSRVQQVDDHESLCATLRNVDHVYTLGASEGMLALIAGVPVHVFGAPYYAGWGLTHDYSPLPSRRARPTLAALFDIVFLHFTNYLNPTSHEPGTLDDLVAAIELQQAVHRRFSDLTHIAGLRFQWWKRPFVTPFLTAGGGALRWTHAPESFASNEHVALWGARSTQGLSPATRYVRIEDGFFHSNGLGSDMNAPRSQVVDRRGIYFDASRPSDLTVLLNEAAFSESELARAAALREQVITLGITKYNLGRRSPDWAAPAGKRIVLVPGQVADDASIRLGTRAIATVDGLLREVRKRRPDAFIVYKPHPDVLSGNRAGLIDAQRLADVVDTEADVLSLVDAADEVHTLSSLAGFDALLRGKVVFTYGLPFYAGWGLTHDALAPIPWRQRTLSLDMLTAGVLLRYPIYWDWCTRLYTTPEAVVAQLAPHAARPLRRVSGNRARALWKASRWTYNAMRHAWWRYRQWNQIIATMQGSEMSGKRQGERSPRT